MQNWEIGSHLGSVPSQQSTNKALALAVVLLATSPATANGWDCSQCGGRNSGATAVGGKMGGNFRDTTIWRCSIGSPPRSRHEDPPSAPRLSIILAILLALQLLPKHLPSPKRHWKTNIATGRDHPPSSGPLGHSASLSAILSAHAYLLSATWAFLFFLLPMGMGTRNV
ncbi:hypothetical protein GGI35DRAFT_127907 [Trichoderma velutinum]